MKMRPIGARRDPHLSLRGGEADEAISSEWTHGPCVPCGRLLGRVKPDHPRLLFVLAVQTWMVWLILGSIPVVPQDKKGLTQMKADARRTRRWFSAVRRPWTCVFDLQTRLAEIK